MLRRRRQAVVENETIDKEVDDALQAWRYRRKARCMGFPVVLVKKKDGTVRLCVDYRAPHAVTVKDVYPLPRIDEKLEALHGSERYT
ncbi:hypothetical protein ON010_g9971 [Phytophthora cinnamomi]|nr:hypothetical protein ON010_g9971 [Phytophthora cinnamomi]